MSNVGITGQRDLIRFDIEILKNRIYSELLSLKQKCDKNIMLNSIAKGADQLCAEIGLALGYELVCPLPFKDYRGDFAGNDLAVYDKLISGSIRAIVVSNIDNRDEAYLAAGKYVVDNCDVLIAIWDRAYQTSICGTMAIINYAKEKQKKVIVICHDC